MTTSNNLMQVLNLIATLFPVFLLVFTFKGFFQALVAKLMGDSTAEDEGFLTLNPLAHVDIAGLSIVLIVFFLLGALLGEKIPRGILFIMLITLGVRWTIPVPINDSNFKKYRLGGILTALSGSLGNFVLAFCATLAIKVVFACGLPRYALVSLLEILKSLMSVAIFFGLLDLIPLPPFDGGRILHYVLPYSQQHIVAWLEQYALYILLILFFAPGVSTLFLNGIATLGSLIERLFFVIVF